MAGRVGHYPPGGGHASVRDISSWRGACELTGFPKVRPHYLDSRRCAPPLPELGDTGVGTRASPDVDVESEIRCGARIHRRVE